MLGKLLISYLLWLPFGVLGAHRFFLGKPFTGLLWLFTGGVCGIGWLVDLFLIPGMVEQKVYIDARRRALAEERALREMPSIGQAGAGRREQAEMQAPPAPAPASRKLSKREREAELQRAILRCAKEHDGVVSVTDVALATGLPLEEARVRLVQLTRSNYVDVGFRDSVVVYYFLEFMPQAAAADADLATKQIRVQRRLAQKLG